MARRGKLARLFPPTLGLGARRSLGTGNGDAVQHRGQLLGGQGGGHLDPVAGLGTVVSGGDEDISRAGVACLVVHHGERSGRVFR